MSSGQPPVFQIPAFAAPAPEAPIFQALIVPYRSLTRKGYMIVVAALMVLSTAIAARFWLLGAWPVVLFSFVDVPLIVLLLTINFRRSRASELIMLDAHELTVVRTDPAGRRQQVSLQSAWLRVDLDAGPGISRVILRSRGRGYEVGAFLHEPERLSLFEALSAAVHLAKNPRFDNPQLRAH
jgi:uncharacterized membrane protein